MTVSRAPDLEECNDAHNQNASLMQRLELIPLCASMGKQHFLWIILLTYFWIYLDIL